ncbi:MAG: alkyl sulfatase dimerization domain-containing protein [Pseudomonadota bacterium]
MYNSQPDNPLSADQPGIGPAGQSAHPDAIAHLQRLQPKLYRVGPHAWCVVGNGLSNQSFVRGPDGIIAIDSGESVEEMRAALKLLRTETDAPIVACIYTHFHYVNGTTALQEDSPGSHLKIYGHAGIAANLQRHSGATAPHASLGLVHQFGLQLPDQGADALLHCGLGLFYRNPAHAPFTAGYVPVEFAIEQAWTGTIAGLEVHLAPAPSDASDSITIWLPELKLCVHNLVWPALFNIYAIRGEPYRDPLVLLHGLDHILELAPTQLIGTHGPPLEQDVRGTVTLYRDAIQYLWDQTVRLANQGATADEAAAQVALPEIYHDNPWTQQFYGVAEHHVRQIYQGLFGWFDGTESKLLPAASRHERLLTGFGGRQQVRDQVQAALDALQAHWDDEQLRWATEQATWLVRTDECDATDLALLSNCLRLMAAHTRSANLRNWCLTRALQLDAEIDLSRFKHHRFNAQQVQKDPAESVRLLRVLLNTQGAAGLNISVAWQFAAGPAIGLHLRHQVAVAVPASSPDIRLGMSTEHWAAILTGRLNFWEAHDSGLISIAGDTAALTQFFSCFELAALQRPMDQNTG